jgi:hypothetical protein
MPRPIAICIEDIETTSEDDRYIRCVAKPSRAGGLALDATGSPVFGESAIHGVCDLVVSLDDQLLLLRRSDAVPITVSRAGRSLEAPVDQRVVLLDRDQVQVGDRHLRIHIHGPSAKVHPPTPLRARSVMAAASVAAVMTLGAGSVGCEQTKSFIEQRPIEVREHPPAAPVLDEDADIPVSPEAAPSASSPIEVRTRPPVAPERPDR